MERINESSSLIDSLLSGKLSSGEKIDAINKINQDPTLKADYQFQTDVVEGIKTARKAALKARLNTIKIDPSLVGIISGSSYFKYAASFLVASSISIGAYLLYTTYDKPTELKFTTPKTNYLSLEGAIPSNLPSSITPIIASEPSRETLVASTDNKIYNTPAVKKEAALETKKKSITAPNLNSVKVVDSFSDDAIITPILESLPYGSNNNSFPKTTSIENILDSKYDFHYQYSESKLYLYGDFKGIPYEIIEVHGKTGRTTYLKHEDVYYSISDSKDKIKPLVAISDATLISEIEMLKKEKLQ
jgi:hypothetical protein